MANIENIVNGLVELTELLNEINDGVQELIGRVPTPTEAKAPDPEAQTELTRGQKAAATRAARRAKPPQVPIHDPVTGYKSGDATDAAKAEPEKTQPANTALTITDVQAKLKALQQAASPDDSPAGKKYGRQVALDVLAGFNVDSVAKLEVQQFAAVIAAADEAISQIEENDDGEGDSDF